MVNLDHFAVNKVMQSVGFGGGPVEVRFLRLHYLQALLDIALPGGSGEGTLGERQKAVLVRNTHILLWNLYPMEFATTIVTGPFRLQRKRYKKTRDRGLLVLVQNQNGNTSTLKGN